MGFMGILETHTLTWNPMWSSACGAFWGFLSFFKTRLSSGAFIRFSEGHNNNNKKCWESLPKPILGFYFFPPKSTFVYHSFIGL